MQIWPQPTVVLTWKGLVSNITRESNLPNKANVAVQSKHEFMILHDAANNIGYYHYFRKFFSYNVAWWEAISLQ